jgi:hypothetical protein
LEKNLSSTHKLILSTILLGIGSVGAAYLFSGVASLIVAATLCLILWIFRPLLMPPGYGATKIRALSLIGIFALATSYGFWAELANTAVAALATLPSVKERAPWVAEVKFGASPSIAILIFVMVCVWIVNHYMRDTSIAGGHPVPMDNDFPDERFDKKLESFVSALRQHLITTDRETNWSPEYYTELEAEVEIVSAAGIASKKRIADLQDAIRSDRLTKAFLILGDPGGGKSVALRKLARDMLDEVGVTGRVPIYINLREWLPAVARQNIQWTEQEKPTVQELESFVIDNVKGRGDVFTEDFVDKYFRKLWQHGRLFFIFDSFDEIPELLDVNEESWLINALSNVLSRFISTHSESRGVLASRAFRRPTQYFLAQKILEIRPMSEVRIVQALQRFPAFGKELQVSLFRDRPELVPIVRNPFLMALLGEWVKDYGALPSSQAELYSNYLHARLRRCSSKLQRARISIAEVLTSAEEIAWFVFQTPAFGLEAPVQVISEQVDTPNASAVMEILSYARIARVTNGDIKSFAFVHRRFLEYFVTKRLLDRPEYVPVEHIPSDSRGRDALVLYAQLCDDNAAKRLAEFCWREITTNFGGQENHLRAIHSLRFLIDAFRSRRSALKSFEESLSAFIQGYAKQADDLIRAKLCLEGTGLLAEDEAVPVLYAALGAESAWLQETAFRACRQLPSLDSNLEAALSSYVSTLKTRHFWVRKSDLLFSLSLSDSLKGVRSAAIARYHSLIVAGAVSPIAAVIQPKAALLFLAFAAELSLMRIVFAFVDEVIEKFFKNVTKRSRLRGLLAPPWIGIDEEGIFQLTRLLFGVGFVLLGGLLLALPLLPQKYSEIVLTAVEWSFVELPPRHRGLLNIILGLAIIDWPLLRLTYRYASARVISVKDNVLAVGGALVVGVPLVYGISRFIEWLKKVDLLWMPGIVASLLFIGLAVICCMELYRRARLRWCDQIRLRNFVVSDRLSREEISRTFREINTKTGRVLFVRKIAESKVTASGSWPADFKLKVSSDLALTELAKLEERWLRLDR